MKQKLSDREVSIGICGAIVGVLLGAGSVVYSQDVSGSLMGDILGSSLTAYVADDFEAVYRSRYGAPAPVAQLTAEEESACVTKVRIAEELRADVLPLLPGRPIDDLVKTAVNKAFDKYIADCKPVQADVIQAIHQEEVPVHTAAPVVEEKVQIDASYCDGLSGARYTSCLGAVRDGIEYQPQD